ncbi:hypothetical protein ACTJJ0_34485 [Chitinophaga sp. 22321]|uniref:Uncharacterized protein n=1 Tax=Chitinophaga hostae TaxID=2831022 RepID=A0ABS5JBB8_9BACT|nr:hypothetical protein [Chitinophaga hostae]MBS0032406.1 hypothetical protein [Chitinophaga hostae]
MTQNNLTQIYWLEGFTGVAHGKHIIPTEDLAEFLKKCNKTGLQVVGLKIGNPVQYLECILYANDSHIKQFGKTAQETWYFRH